MSLNPIIDLRLGLHSSDQCVEIERLVFVSFQNIAKIIWFEITPNKSHIIYGTWLAQQESTCGNKPMPDALRWVLFLRSTFWYYISKSMCCCHQHLRTFTAHIFPKAQVTSNYKVSKRFTTVHHAMND